MFRDIIGRIAGVELFPIVATLLLMAAFVAIVIRVIRADKKQIEYLSRLPLDSDETAANRTEVCHE